ncbi:RNA ligase, DRB0094 family [Pleurostoma richardsiae]|uniref:RNA ligase, DRB0094 family n=1 Tax=Pleurostoma richardsiae TaxID=41990 RepID=A0AA38VLD0_9PEZI|nr:RNA ligase, DRB0094 family [Pleurostoma richardsiae]
MPRQPRRLVSVHPVTDVRPVHGARLEVITIRDSWTVVVPRSEFVTGEHVVYFEIDSFIPDTDVRIWERSRSFVEFRGRHGYHVRSRVVRGQLSQGLAFGLEEFPEIERVLQDLERQHSKEESMEKLMEMSFEDKLGVVEWEVPFEFKGKSLGKPPLFFRQPGCQRAQSVPQLFTPQYLNEEFQVTEKLDGVSMTVYRVAQNSPWYKMLPELPPGSIAEKNGARVGVVSQQDDIDENCGSLYWEVAKELNITDKINQVGIKNVAIHGELVGHTIKHNSLAYPPGEHTFIVFEMFDIDKQRWLRQRDTVHICNKLNLTHAPILGYYRLRDFANGLQDLLRKAEGVGFRGQNREGLVLKTYKDGFAVKVISNSWLVQHGE